eukprot:942211_1
MPKQASNAANSSLSILPLLFLSTAIPHFNSCFETVLSASGPSYPPAAPFKQHKKPTISSRSMFPLLFASCFFIHSFSPGFSSSFSFLINAPNFFCCSIGWI